MAALPKTAQKVKRLVPLFNRIIVKRDETPKETKGGIVLPDNAKGQISKGTVIACGPGSRNEKGLQVPMSIKPGDEVILPDYGGTKLEIENETFFMYRESEILAKFSD